ncbi:MAG: thymidine phosphorylase [Acidobacteriota bacterium]
MSTPRAFHVIERKRRGASLEPAEIRALCAGAADGSWPDAELGAFLMAAAIRGLDAEETHELTRAMLESGEQWDLAADLPDLGDKHSTGGVGDGVSLLLAPLMAACGRPVMMLAGRGLGHTGGTVDKLEAIPGIELSLDRARCLETLQRTSMAIGQATGSIAPADKRLYALRDRTATIDVLPLICGSILSKKLAVGAAAMVFDVKAGNGAFMRDADQATDLARLLVETARALGREASALVTDMSQPLGRWVGHLAEVLEIYECFAGEGAEDFVEITYRLCEELTARTGERIERAEMEHALTSGAARQALEDWAALQGADAGWLRAPEFTLAPHEVVIEAPHDGRIGQVETRRLGELVAEAGGGRLRADDEIDDGIALRVARKRGDEVSAGDEIARLFLRRDDSSLVARVAACWQVVRPDEEPVEPPPLIQHVID